MSIGHLLRAAGATLRISVPTLFDALLGRLTPEVCDTRLDWWSRRLLGQAEVSLQTSGIEHARGARAFVVMSNHQSLYDIPALYQSLPLRLRMVAKAELFRIPIWAQAMRAAGFVELDRSARERAIESLERAKAALAQGTSIWIAPEGTRSKGRLARCVQARRLSSGCGRWHEDLAGHRGRHALESYRLRERAWLPARSCV